MKEAWLEHSDDGGCYIRVTQTLRECMNGINGRPIYSLQLRSSINDLASMNTMEMLYRRDRSHRYTIKYLGDMSNTIGSSKCHSLRDMSKITQYQTEEDVVDSIPNESTSSNVLYSFAQIRVLAKGSKVYI